MCVCVPPPAEAPRSTSVVDGAVLLAGGCALPFAQQPVPQRQELALHAVHRRALRAVPLAQEGVHLVDEYDAGGQLPRQLERRRYQLVALPEPLVHDGGELDVDEGRVRLLGDGLGEHRLSRSGRTVKQNPLRRRDQSRVAHEQIRPQQREDDEIVYLRFDVVHPPHVRERDSQIGRVDDVALRDRHLVRSEGFQRGQRPLVLQMQFPLQLVVLPLGARPPLLELLVQPSPPSLLRVAAVVVVAVLLLLLPAPPPRRRPVILQLLRHRPQRRLVSRHQQPLQPRDDAPASAPAAGLLHEAVHVARRSGVRALDFGGDPFAEQVGRR
mmetsp:Transcript_44972/g.95689  ORF Transcript_44972/g.95689 Transcript_44972/m.95689 type:complete len:326 (-) Transcript_44972:14-991(-)